MGKITMCQSEIFGLDRTIFASELTKTQKGYYGRTGIETNPKIVCAGE